MITEEFVKLCIRLYPSLPESHAKDAIVKDLARVVRVFASEMLRETGCWHYKQKLRRWGISYGGRQKMKVEGFKCDQCSTIKGKTNGWFSLESNPNELRLTIVPFNSHALIHICGLGCLHEFISGWFTINVK